MRWIDTKTSAYDSSARGVCSVSRRTWPEDQLEGRSVCICTTAPSARCPTVAHPQDLSCTWHYNFTPPVSRRSFVCSQHLSAVNQTKYFLNNGLVVIVENSETNIQGGPKNGATLNFLNSSISQKLTDFSIFWYTESRRNVTSDDYKFIRRTCKMWPLYTLFSETNTVRVAKKRGHPASPQTPWKLHDRIEWDYCRYFPAYLLIIVCFDDVTPKSQFTSIVEMKQAIVIC